MHCLPILGLGQMPCLKGSHIARLNSSITAKKDNESRNPMCILLQHKKNCSRGSRGARTRRAFTGGAVHLSYLTPDPCLAPIRELSSSAWLDGLSSASLDLEIESTGGRMCDGTLGECYDGEEENEWMMESDVQGRLLRRVRYYISYGALAANRVPCRPRSGRSYYTRNCHRASGPVNPYHRGCSAITRCRRYTS